MSMQKEKNMLKEQATKNAGYDFKFIEILREKGLPVATEWQRWESLMTLE